MKDEEFNFSTDEELLEQARKDIKKQLKGRKDELPPPKPKEPTLEELIQDAINEFEKQKKLVKAMNHQQLAEWLIDKHESWTTTMNYMFRCDCLDCQDVDDRALKILYMNELNNLLFAYEIDEIHPEVVEILQREKQVDLMCILHVLDLIP